MGQQEPLVKWVPCKGCGIRTISLSFSARVIIHDPVRYCRKCQEELNRIQAVA